MESQPGRQTGFSQTAERPTGTAEAVAVDQAPTPIVGDTHSRASRSMTAAQGRQKPINAIGEIEMNTTTQKATSQLEILTRATNSRLESGVASAQATDDIHPEAYCKEIFRKLDANSSAIQRVGATKFSFDPCNVLDVRDHFEMECNGRRIIEFGAEKLLEKLRESTEQADKDDPIRNEMTRSYKRARDLRILKAVTPTVAFRDITHDWLFLAIRSRVMSMLIVSGSDDVFSIGALCGHSFWKSTTENQKVRGRYYVRIAAMTGLWPIRCVYPVIPALDVWNGECDPHENDMYQPDLESLVNNPIPTDHFKALPIGYTTRQ